MWRERCQGTEAVRPLPDRLAAIAICSATTSRESRRRIFSK
jgi:hypothetical protein